MTLAGTTLYGMTAEGGVNGIGNVFSVGIGGTNYQNLLSFTGSAGAASGEVPHGNLALSGTNLYGMTNMGGYDGVGNVFSVGTDSTNYQNLVSFTGPNTTGSASGWRPYGSLTLSGSIAYGMTDGGGADGNGNVFSVGIDGTNYQNLFSFPFNVVTGSPLGGGASGNVLLSNSTLYGMSPGGGPNGYGTIFSVGTNGANFRNLVFFTGTSGSANGENQNGSLILSGTSFYGMTYGGGTDGVGNIFSVGVNGTGYQNLLSFTGTGGAAIGQYPSGSLVLCGTTLYGMTRFGGANGDGNIFSAGIDGSNYQNLYSFTDGTDGQQPFGDLTLSGGTLFGMTGSGGASNDGIVFAFDLPAPTPEPGSLALVGMAAAAAAIAILSRQLRMKNVTTSLQ